MRYRSAAFARQSAHALASPGSTHFPARGVDADAFLSSTALLYLLGFSSDIITSERSLITGVVTPVRIVAAVVLITFTEIVRVDVVGPALVILAIICLAVLIHSTLLFHLASGARRGPATIYVRLLAVLLAVGAGSQPSSSPGLQHGS